MPTAINALGASDAAAVKGYTVVGPNGNLGNTITYPKTTDVAAKYAVAKPWQIETGYSDFPGQTYADPVICIGYNVDVGTGQKDPADIGLGFFLEADYFLAGTRYAEFYAAMRGGSVDNNNRPFFFQWNRVTGSLDVSQIHAAGPNGTSGFKVLRPLGSQGEAGNVLHTFSRNTITVECDDTTANTVLSLKGGSTNRGGQITLGYGVTSNAFSILLSSANNSELQFNAGAAAIHLWGNPAGGANVGAMSLGRQGGDGGGALGNSQLLAVDLTAASNGVFGIRIRAKATGTDMIRLQDSAGVDQIAVTRAGLLTMGAANMTTGTSTATFTATNKPGASSAVSPTQWVKVALSGGGTFWIPAWAD